MTVIRLYLGIPHNYNYTSYTAVMFIIMRLHSFVSHTCNYKAFHVMAQNADLKKQLDPNWRDEKIKYREIIDLILYLWATLNAIIYQIEMVI